MKIPEIFRPVSKITYPQHTTGVALEERARLYFKTRKPQTDRNSLLINWTAYAINHEKDWETPYKYLQEFVNSLPRGEKYWTIVQHDDGPKVDFPFDIKIFAAGGNPGDAIPIPLVCDPHTIPDTKDKDFLCTFIGNSNTHPIRRKIIESVWGKEKTWIGRKYGKEYAEYVSRSKFSLCPRGYGKTSFRLYEAIWLSSIPVYISDEFWIPYKDELDWTQFSVMITEQEIPDIYDILQSISDDRYEEMMDNLKAVRPLFTFDGTFEAIKGILEREYRNKK